MAKRLTRIEREIRDHPEKFDFGDIPPDYKLTPEQQASYDAMAHDWVKRSKRNREHSERTLAENQIVIDAFKANFKACR